MLVRQLEEELRMRMRGPSIEVQQQMEVIYQENEHLSREIAILRDTIKVTYQHPSVPGTVSPSSGTLQSLHTSHLHLLHATNEKRLLTLSHVSLFSQTNIRYI